MSALGDELRKTAALVRISGTTLSATEVRVLLVAALEEYAETADKMDVELKRLDTIAALATLPSHTRAQA